MNFKVTMHTINRAIPLPDYLLFLEFHDGTRKIYDIKQLFKHKTLGAIFSQLKTKEGLAEKVKVDDGGYGLVWDDDIDLCCDDLYYFGQTIVGYKSKARSNSNGHAAAKPTTTRA